MSDELVDVGLVRIVLRDDDENQYIVLAEKAGARQFPIVIGRQEAGEIHRVVHGHETTRPLTHQLTFEALTKLDSELTSADIVALKQNTFFARLNLRDNAGREVGVDARPSDAIALALRAGCPIRVAESVLAKSSESES